MECTVQNQCMGLSGGSLPLQSGRPLWSRRLVSSLTAHTIAPASRGPHDNRLTHRVSGEKDLDDRFRSTIDNSFKWTSPPRRVDDDDRASDWEHR